MRFRGIDDVEKNQSHHPMVQKGQDPSMARALPILLGRVAADVESQMPAHFQEGQELAAPYIPLRVMGLSGCQGAIS